ncbi:hypothetical protein PDL71_01525 [Lacibacter sp. MH-610]|uniref:hypothetical protein n=1 Tax=Lacibacter sp. MH-610 TaxID=3020883 RepID=UPI003891D537
MRTYDEIKNELLAIADVLKKYPENIQPKVFDILTSHFLDKKPETKVDESSETEKLTPKAKTKSASTSKPSGKSAKKSNDSVTLIKDLDLRKKGEKSFKDFYEEKKPGASNEFNSVAVYYLSEILELSGITPSHIFTCYKEVTKRPPEAFIQSLRDTASKNGYIDTGDINNIKIPLRGKNFVEHDLPKQKAKK